MSWVLVFVIGSQIYTLEVPRAFCMNTAAAYDGIECLRAADA